MENEANRTIALKVFERIRAAFPHLKMDFLLEHPHVDINVDIPEQPGLVFPVNLNLQGDELHLCVGRNFWVEWFPCSDSERASEYEEIVTGMLSGRYRLRERFVFGRPVSASIQSPSNDGWKDRATWGNPLALIPWKRTNLILQNASNSEPV